MTTRTASAVLSLAAFMAGLDLFIVNVAFAADFSGPSLSGVSWVLHAYAVVYAAQMLPCLLVSGAGVGLALPTILASATATSRRPAPRPAVSW